MIAAQVIARRGAGMATQDTTQLRSNSIGLVDVVFQSVTYMAAAAATAFAIVIGLGFVATALPLSAIVGLIACMLCAVSIGQLGKFIPTAGGRYTLGAPALGP